ncbi:HAMP domain-containing histidine kinase [Patescibacteria group bacterium]|nr:HAMP domain-containing histidine kinase [Patescibacteria group bacterium]
MGKTKPKKIPRRTRKPVITETVSIIAHQLKSPLSVIKGYLEALISGDCGRISSFQKEYLSDALENVERMKKNIDDLLIVQRVEEGRYEIVTKPLSLEEIVFQILADFSLWAKALNCQILFKKPKALPRVLGDPKGIREVIENLISNAMKYSRGRGKVEISISLKAKNEKLIFACKDNGVSVPKKDFKKVFTKFYRSEKAMELDPSGAGLGLYINKAIIGLCGGEIWFSKNKGFGMTFYFSLPIAK